jgi:hypothetical protein
MASRPAIGIQLFCNELKRQGEHRDREWFWTLVVRPACEYVTKIADAIFVTGSAQAQQWARDSRQVLLDEVDGSTAPTRARDEPLPSLFGLRRRLP